MKAMTSLLQTVALIAVVSGCNDLSQKWELDHARVLAVRLSPPALGPGESGSVDALVVDDQGVPLVITPSIVSNAGEQIGIDPAVTAAISVSPSAGGWDITAGDQAALDGARAALALADDDSLNVQFGAFFSVSGQDFFTIKAVRLGEAAANPPTPGLLVDGVPVASTVAVGRDRDITLTLSGLPDAPADPSTAEDADVLSIDWATGTGELTGSQSRTATLTIPQDAPNAGYLVAIVRNRLGGASWMWIQLTVE